MEIIKRCLWIASTRFDLVSLFYLFIFLNLSNATNILFSCQTAQYVDNSGLFCSDTVQVTWLTASAYIADNFSVYYPGAPISIVNQNKYAQELFTQLNNIKSSDALSTCHDFNKMYSCLAAFPLCPLTAPSLTSSGYAYLKTCRLQCQLVEKTCKPKQSLHCNQLPVEGCSLYIQSDMFLLSKAQGPYEALSILYPIILTCWIILLLLWVYGTFIHYNKRCILLCKILTIVPFLKVLSLIFGCLFWITCNHMDICYSWMSVAYINIHLVYETGLLAAFILIAKGWRITRHKLMGEEWRVIIILLSSFYMANSIIAVLEAAILTSRAYWILIGILYGSLYLFIFLSLRLEIIKIYIHFQYLKDYMPRRFQLPLQGKKNMYTFFLFFIFLSINLEVLCHILIAYHIKYTIVLCIYEIIELVLISSIGYFFRPQEYSPFFFMIPSRIHDAGTRPLPVIHLEKYNTELEEGHHNSTTATTTTATMIVTTEAAGTSDEEGDGLLASSSPSSFCNRDSNSSIHRNSVSNNSHNNNNNNNSSTTNNNSNNIHNNNSHQYSIANTNSNNPTHNNPTSPNSSMKSKLIAGMNMTISSSSSFQKHSKSGTQKQPQHHQLVSNQLLNKYEIELGPLMDLGMNNNHQNHRNHNNNNNHHDDDVDDRNGDNPDENHTSENSSINNLPDWKLAFIQSVNNGRISIGLISASNSSRN